MQDTAIEYSTPPVKKTWSVGTLTYTAGGLVALFCWLLWGDFVLQLKEKSVPPALQILLKQFQASDLLKASLIGVLPHALAMVLQPIISYRSDRHRGRWGRRIPYLLLPTPIAALSVVGLAFAPMFGRWMSEMGRGGMVSQSSATLFNLALFWTLFELSSIVCNSVFVALINDVVPREMLGRFFALFRIFSLAASMTFTWFLLGQVQERYVLIFICIGALYGLGFGAMCLFVKEGNYPPPDAEAVVPGAKPHGFLSAAATYFRDCFSHSYYVWYFIAIALANVAFQPVLLFFLDMSVSLGMSNDALGKHVQTPQLFCSLLLGYPIGWLCDKIHPMRVTLLAIGMYAIVTLAAFFVIRDSLSFTFAQIICGTVAGIWSTASNPLAATLLPKREFASFVSAMNIVVSLAVMITSGVTGKLLDLLHHEYRYIYLWASAFSVLSLLALLVVYKKFNSYGGTKAYVAPL